MKRKAAFNPIDPAKPLPAGVSAYVIGKPRRIETPLLIPSHRALVFGDAVAEEGGRLRVWAAGPRWTTGSSASTGSASTRR